MLEGFIGYKKMDKNINLKVAGSSGLEKLQTQCTVPSPGIDRRLKSTCGRTPRGIQGRKSTD